MDGKDYSVYSILPPYNNINAQVISGGKLVRSASGVTVTYEAVADPTGSINRTSAGKTTFWQWAQALFGVKLPVDAGLAGQSMPGARNVRQPMKFDAAYNYFRAEGIPITPYDDAGVKNYYPMMKVSVRNSSGTVLASTNIVLPVSDEIDCKSCHASGSASAAKPAGNWVYLSDPEKDYKMNVLRIHDERQLASAAFTAALKQAGYSAAGLEATVNTNKTPILCARCHLSNALKIGMTGISQLTTAIHKHHALVTDPSNGLPLDSISNRSACYRCHPGSTTKCLRGAMGNAAAPDGTMLMQCQNCHGNMSAVGMTGRNGWLDEPSCQNCHTGTALANNGQIRYTSVFDTSGLPRVAVNTTFATSTSLYRFSSGHGGLQCEGCHGSTHAEYPSSHTNDNLQNTTLQGYAGTLAECTTCHPSVPSTVTGGPHGMHPIGQTWVSAHHDVIHGDPGPCRTCHGMDYRGTVLSAARTTRTLNVDDGRKVTIAKGTPIGCYTCHNGPNGGD